MVTAEPAQKYLLPTAKASPEGVDGKALRFASKVLPRCPASHNESLLDRVTGVTEAVSRQDLLADRKLVEDLGSLRMEGFCCSCVIVQDAVRNAGGEALRYAAEDSCKKCSVRDISQIEQQEFGDDPDMVLLVR